MLNSATIIFPLRVSGDRRIKPFEALSPDEAVHIALDIEQLAYEATRLLDAASLINRLAKE